MKIKLELEVYVPSGIRTVDVSRCLLTSIEDKGWHGTVKNRSRVAKLEQELAQLKAKLEM